MVWWMMTKRRRAAARNKYAVRSLKVRYDGGPGVPSRRDDQRDEALGVEGRTLRVSFLIASFCLIGFCCSNATAWSRYGNIESSVLACTNQERMRYGLPPLRLDPALARAARGHSDEMLRLRYFSHDSPTPSQRDVSQRCAAAGCPYVEVGENIAYYQGYGLDNIAQRVVADWMASPGHRANILRARYTAIGVGISFDHGVIMATQDFANEAPGAYRRSVTTQTREEADGDRHTYDIQVLGHDYRISLP